MALLTEVTKAFISNAHKMQGLDMIDCTLTLNQSMPDNTMISKELSD